MRRFLNGYKIFTMILFTVLAKDITAQQPGGCATPKPTGAAKLVPADFQRPTDISGMRMIKLYFYVTRPEWQGAQAAQTEEEIMAHFEIVRQQFAPYGICFILAGITEIVSDELAHISASSYDDSVLVRSYANSRPDCLSVFIHNGIAGDVIGTAWNIPNNYVSLEGSYVWGGFSVLASHEIGHALGLLHTFENYYGIENVPRSGGCSNCSTTGDLICDTDADLRDVPGYHVSNTCTYLGNLTDDCGNTYLMELDNVMSYNAWVACTYTFTAGQANRMHYTINTTPALQNVLLGLNAFTITNSLNYSGGNYSFTYRDNLTVNSSAYTVTGSARMQISSAEIVLKPGVTLSPGSSGITVLRANALCR